MLDLLRYLESIQQWHFNNQNWDVWFEVTLGLNCSRRLQRCRIRSAANVQLLQALAGGHRQLRFFVGLSEHSNSLAGTSVARSDESIFRTRNTTSV